MERPEREHFLLEVLEDDSVHANSELLPGLPVLRVIREPAARGLELARVKHELAGGPGTPRFGAGRRARLGVSDLALLTGFAQELTGGAEPRDSVDVLLGRTRATLVALVVDVKAPLSTHLPCREM